MRTKILLLVAILICVTLASNAQIDKGRYLIGGNLGFSNSKGSQSFQTSKSRYNNLNIQFGEVINENEVVGVILSYINSKYYYSNADTVKNNQYSVAVFYREYKKLAKDFYFFGEGNLGYTHVKTSQVNQGGSSNYKSTSNGPFMSFVPGLSYSVCKKLQMELAMPDLIKVYYTHSAGYNNGTQKGNNFSFNSNLNSNLLSNFGIGFKFLLGK